MAASDVVGTGNGLNWEIGKRAVIDGRLYEQQLEKAQKYCDEASSALRARKEDPGRVAPSASALPNTVIGVVGERGSGKTSFLHTLKEKLPASYYKLEVVDPSNFESDMSALELFLARIFQEYTLIRSQRSQGSGMYESPRLHALFREISSRLSGFRIDGGVYRTDNPSMEVLNHMVGLVEIGSKLQELCDEFLSYANATPSEAKSDQLILFIDDVDMIENGKVYRLLEDVRKFLSGRIVVVIAYRDKQLMDSIFDQKIRENENLFRRNLISDRELQLQIEDFIEKVIPIDRTVRLMSQKDILEKPILDALASLVEEGSQSSVLYDVLVAPYVASCGLSDSPTVREWLDTVLYSKVLLRMAPVNEQEETTFVWPRNLRELVSLAKVLHCDLEDVEPGVFDKENCEAYQLNLRRYRDYYLSRLGEALDPALYEIVDKWLRSRCEAKNYVVYADISRLLLERISESKDESNVSALTMDDLLDSSLVRPDNVTVGDVSTLLRRFERACHTDEACIHLGYSFKVLYSMECLGHLLGALGDGLSGSTYEDSLAKICGSGFLDNYLALINSCVIPPEVSESELSYALVYPCASPEWQKASPDHSGPLVEASAETIRRVILSFVSSNIVAPRQGSLPGDTVADSSRPLRRRSGRLNRYSEAQNRPFFTLANVDLTNGDLYDLVKASSPDSAYRYYFNLLNVLGKRWYVTEALSNLMRTGASVYLFYSMFDLDVIASMQLDPKRPQSEKIEYQMRKINAALIASQENASEASGIEKKDSGPFVMNISAPHEQKRAKRLHTPFISDTAFRLFGHAVDPRRSDAASLEVIEGGDGSIISFRDVEAVYRMALDLASRTRNSVKRRLYPGLLRLFKTGGKNEFCNFADEFAAVLSRHDMSEEAEMVLVAVERLRAPNVRPRQEERSELEGLAREWPAYANEAFGRGHDE